MTASYFLGSIKGNLSLGSSPGFTFLILLVKHAVGVTKLGNFGRFRVPAWKTHWKIQFQLMRGDRHFRKNRLASHLADKSLVTTYSQVSGEHPRLALEVIQVTTRYTTQLLGRDPLPGVQH